MQTQQFPHEWTKSKFYLYHVTIHPSKFSTFVIFYRTFANWPSLVIKQMFFHELVLDLLERGRRRIYHNHRRVCPVLIRYHFVQLLCRIRSQRQNNW